MGVINNNIEQSVAYLHNKLSALIEQKTKPVEMAKTIPGYSESGTKVLKLVNGVPQWVSE